jgi:hypothetical protein
VPAEGVGVLGEQLRRLRELHASLLGVGPVVAPEANDLLRIGDRGREADLSGAEQDTLVQQCLLLVRETALDLGHRALGRGSPLLAQRQEAA